MFWWSTDEKERSGGGGGGRPRIRLGRTGPRGRMYSKAATAPKGTVAIAKNKFIKAGKGSRAAIREHLRYIQERERGENEPERKFFDRNRDGIERQEVFDKMLEGRGDRTAAHTLILSPGDNNIDIRDYTRESMEALEERLGHDLDWYATIHENTDHHHAHVVIGGRIPGRERDLERDYTGGRGYAADEGRWTDEQKELRELLGKGYDERAETDPREDRAAERSRWGDGGEREPTDPNMKDLLGDSARSPEEMRTERMLDRYERQMAAQEAAKERGEVYLDVNDLRELRSAGNDYVHRERSLERELERAYEREFGRDYEPDRFRERDRELERGEPEQDRGGEDMDAISRMFESDRELSREMERSDDRDDRGRDDDERERGRDRGDDFGR